MSMKYGYEPQISVIMSVYNTRKDYLIEAINSILNQTFEDFEFIIIDDASDDSTKEVLKSIKDDRVRLITNDNNKGLTANLNMALGIAKGKYIARMDADDVSYPNRLERTYKYMEKNPEVNILGTYVKWGDKRRKSYGNIAYEARKALFMINNAGPVHPTAMIRKEFLDRYHISYDEYYRKAQDYDLWSRCIEYTDIKIYPEVLLFYRVHDGQISQAIRGEQDFYATEIKARQFSRIGTEYTIDKLESFVRSRLKAEMSLEDYKEFAIALLSANEQVRYYDLVWFRYVIIWYLLKFIKYNTNGLARVLSLVKIFSIKNVCCYISCGIRILV